MFCSVCESEFRPGITRCPSCDADLVAEPAERRPVAKLEVESAAESEMLDYCGFLALDDARAARDLLRPRSIRSEIVIRDATEPGLAHRSGEEYWLRVPARSFPQVAEVLGRHNRGQYLHLSHARGSHRFL